MVIFLKNSYSSEDLSNQCEWENKSKIPCVEIIGNISNTSKFSKNAIKKTVITRKQIIESGAIDLIDVLNTVPNIHITQSGPKGQQASLFMRGTGSNHTLVLINGVAINDQSTTQGLHDFGVDFIQTVQQVEVYPGPSAIHFGPNAIGGAINIITTGDYQDSISFKSSDKNNNDFLLNKTLLTNNSSLINFKFGGVNSETGSAKYGGKENDKLKNLSTNLNFEKWHNDQIKIKNSTYIRQTIAQYDSSSSNEIGFEGNNKMATTQFELFKSSKNHNDKYTFYYNNYDREYDEQGVIDYYNSEATGIKYDRTGILTNNLSFGLGSEYRYDWGNFENNGTSYNASTKGHVDNISFYGNLGLEIFTNTNLSGFLRNDKNKVTGSNKSYKLNLEQKINNYKFGFTRVTGLRNPTIYEMFGTDNYGYSGNQNLNPEKNNSNEMYSEIKFKNNFLLNLTLFKSNIYDHIEYSSNKYINNSNNIDLNQSGMVSELKFFNESNKISLFTSSLSSKKVDGSSQLRRPEKTYGFNISKKMKNNFFGKFNLNINYNHYGKHFDTHSSNFSKIEMDSTDIVNISLTKKMGMFEMFLISNNLFDENYQRPHGYSQDGRNFKLGLKTTY